ncbi:hypothetical protein HRI_000515500 [Hibiscus trionum]|uniref:Endonuclease/exonuclease/phosphatase domain-containing protein n=1 Tax=Hibiscus trionum TaxID=183268 RepID=A0A9W7LL35_HIBTR|nr:hypothetical protein HRI_000515500 [Hibiscus trionum]
MRVFADFIDNLCLIDLPLQGSQFTWSSFRERPSFSRLDRILVSPEVAALWPNISKVTLSKKISDHNPIYLSIEEHNWGPKPFRWFDSWSEDKNLVDSIKHSCLQNQGLGLSNILKMCKSDIKSYHLQQCNAEQSSIKDLEEKC